MDVASLRLFYNRKYSLNIQSSIKNILSLQDLEDPMKKFINDPYDVVDEMLEGFLDVHKKYVRKLDAVRTVVRADAPLADKVGVYRPGHVRCGGCG
jgi:hypothetical protein